MGVVVMSPTYETCYVFSNSLGVGIVWILAYFGDCGRLYILCFCQGLGDSMLSGW